MCISFPSLSQHDSLVLHKWLLPENCLNSSWFLLLPTCVCLIVPVVRLWEGETPEAEIKLHHRLDDCVEKEKYWHPVSWRGERNKRGRESEIGGERSLREKIIRIVNCLKEKKKETYESVTQQDTNYSPSWGPGIALIGGEEGGEKSIAKKNKNHHIMQVVEDSATDFNIFLSLSSPSDSFSW